MCGIAGIITFDSWIDVDHILNVCSETQKHRGPDANFHEVFVSGRWKLGLAHQRLSVIDLSNSGVQPMLHENSGSAIVYNGEVYNYKEIKETLSSNTYKSSTDTEVVLTSLVENGIDKALNEFNGMWGFAWYDKAKNKVYLCRDRVGIKPLYYYKKKNTLYFSSEIKTILEASGEQFKLNHQVVGEYLCQALQDTSTSTFYKNIYSVSPGHYIEIDLAADVLDLKESCYWNVEKSAPYKGDDLTGDVKTLFDDAVRLRMRSDVPVGVTLSGGLDSSAIASSMKKYLGSENKLNIISAVSPGSDLDESNFIDIMTDYLKVDANKVCLDWDAEEAVPLLKKVIWHNDTPVGSFSNVAHYLMMKKAHELGITVILSGQGADELLCGYKKYLGFYVQSLLKDSSIFKAISVLFGFVVNRSVIFQFNFMEAKRYLPSFFHMSDVDIKGKALKQEYKPVNLSLKSKQTMQSRQIEDLKHYSVPFLTHYEDRMSMAWSREIRLPFLDYRLIELFANLPTKHKLYKGWTKYIFRKAMEDVLPKSIVWRKDKQGFVNPQEQWLKNELKNEVLNTFSREALIFSMGLVDREVLMSKYEEYCHQKQGKGRIWYREIFAPFALEIWLQINQKNLDI